VWNDPANWYDPQGLHGDHTGTIYEIFEELKGGVKGPSEERLEEIRKHEEEKRKRQEEYSKRARQERYEFYTGYLNDLWTVTPPGSYCKEWSRNISCAADAATVAAVAATAFTGGVAAPGAGIIATTASVVSFGNGVASFLICSTQWNQATSVIGVLLNGWYGAAVSILDAALAVKGI
jgi:hypothetical protein